VLLNSLFCFADRDGFGFGAEDHFGLFIDKSLNHGSSHFCKTFLNEPLVPESHF
jgi:hypothetical protein